MFCNEISREDVFHVSGEECAVGYAVGGSIDIGIVNSFLDVFYTYYF